MWSLARSIFAASLAASAVTAQLSFVASVQQDGQDADASALGFKQIPPMSHGRHAARPRSGHGHGGHRATERDAISYSSNWCGASQHTNRQDSISSAYGYFTVPDLTLRPGIPAPQFAAAWVGIDGAECNSTLLQAGVTTVVNSNGGQSASAWWEWYPEAAFTIHGLQVKPGDWMAVNVTATSATSGIIVIANSQRGYSVTLEVNNGPALCRVDAEWIVEDFYESGEHVAFAHFSDVWFVDSGATTASGKDIGFNGAAMVHLQDDDGKVLCMAERYDNSNLVMFSQG